MSDSSAKAKLAAAKKRFKELKELKENGHAVKKNVKKSENQIVNNESAPQQISFPLSESTAAAEDLQHDLKTESNATFTGNSYFYEPPLPSASSFFDSIPTYNNDTEQYNDFNIPTTLNDTNPFNDQGNLEERDSVAFEDPEIKQNEIFERVNMITHEDARKLEEYLQQEAQGDGAYKTDVNVNEYEHKITALENYNTQLQQSVQPLQEQLEYYRKTIQILVDEKTELIAQLNESQGVSKQKLSESEDLQGRLRASRSRVADLEKEINCLKSLKNDFERNGVDKLREYDNLITEYRQLKENSEESQQISSELQEKFNVQVATNQHLEKKLQDSKSQLEKLHLRLQQLNMGHDVPAYDNIKEKQLEQQIENLQEALKTANAETEQASKQYQQYVEQLNAQRQNLANRIETLTTENIDLGNREQNLIQHIGQLEKLLQEKPVAVASNSASESELNAKLNEMKTDLEAANLEKSKLFEANKKTETERVSLEQSLHEAQEKVLELEALMAKQKADQPNMVELLATMESDKVAAARAVTQNNELKKQLEELQAAFVRMSNDKLELTEKLEAEQHYNKEVHEKWKEKNGEVERLQFELSHLQTNAVDMNKQIILQNQLTDRLRHYEAQGQISDSLQKQLQEYKHVVDTLTTENQQLKQQTSAPAAAVVNNEELEKTKELVENLKTENDVLKKQCDAYKQETFMKNIPEDLQQHMQTLRDLADSNKLNFENLLQEYLELQQCKLKYDSLKTENEALRSRLSGNNSSEPSPEKNVNGEIANIDKEHAMEQLEFRFTKMMTDVANLTDEKQRLEHIVLQLQGETETIGEYIALYQYQRAILKEKTLEKDEQLKRLAQDREEVKSKLEDLNSLIRQLFKGDKHQIPSDVLAKHEHLNSQACSEHSHLQEQLNVTKEQSNVISPDNDNNNGKIQTADKIMALLSEIKTSNLVQPNDGSENFHPCPWCSGQLITV